MTALFALSVSLGAQQHPSSSETPAAIFQRGSDALRAGSLSLAEADFRAVTRVDPGSSAAFTNLGVTLMREKRWQDALGPLEKAKRLDPAQAGIPLDLGLVYFHTNDYAKAVPQFREALGHAPQNTQARFLLGLSCFLTGAYPCAAETLEPLWNTQSGNLTYLYVLGSAAARAKLPGLEDKAFRRMATVGNGTAEFHLYAGKAMLGKEDYAAAAAELQQATALEPTLPMAHFFLAEALDGQHDEKKARAELQTEIQLEPDVPYSYDELGRVCSLLGDTAAAETAYRDAIARDPSLRSSYLGLATLYQQQGRASEALTLLDRAIELSPNSGSVHFLRGQVLRQLHRTAESRVEFARSAALLREFHDDLQQGGSVAHDADAADILHGAEL